MTCLTLLILRIKRTFWNKSAYSAEFRRAFLFISGQRSDSIRAPSYVITERWVEATISQRFLLVND